MIQYRHVVVTISHLNVVFTEVFFANEDYFHKACQAFLVVGLFKVEQRHHEIGIASLRTVLIIKLLNHFDVVNIRVFAFLKLFESMIQIRDLTMGR